MNIFSNTKILSAKPKGTINEETKILRDSFFRRVREILRGKSSDGKLVDDSGKVLLPKGEKLTDELLEGIPRKYWGDM